MTSSYILTPTGEKTILLNTELKTLQKAVGGFIEIHELQSQGICIVINEEGKLLNLPINPTATEMWQKEYGAYDFIVGNVVVSTKEQL